MTNPSLLWQLAQQRQREIFTATRARRLGSLPTVRARLGWLLVGLGERLALDAHAREPISWNRAST